jgi:hypothetical protein
MWLYQFFNSYITPVETTTQHGTIYGTVFSNIAELNGNYDNNPNEIEFGIVLGVGSRSDQIGWNGWDNINGRNWYCDDCYLTQTTSLAQNPEAHNDGSFFGPTEWWNMGIGDLASPGVYFQCLNYPIWRGNECGNTPATPLSSVIQVSNQSLVPLTGTETVRINNAQGNWIVQFPSSGSLAPLK